MLPNILKDNTEEYEVRHILSYTDTSIPFSEGTLTTRVLINDSSALNKKMDKIYAIYMLNNLVEDINDTKIDLNLNLLKRVNSIDKINQ